MMDKDAQKPKLVEPRRLPTRWVVERTVSWPAGCRRLHRRYERKSEPFLAS
jgi:transposase